jgi:putative hydroxymethylpyrimidine transport system substrate-binding protein
MRSVRKGRRWWVLPLLAAVLLALAAAGCGGGNESSGEPAAQPTTEAPASDTSAADTSAAETPTTEATTEAAPEPASLTVALDWFPNPDHIPLYYALDKGYWTDESLDVTLKKPSDPTAGLKLVATNKFDLAIYYESEIYFAAEKNIPVITVASLIPNPLNSLIALGDSKVKGPDTIKGAKIGVAGLPTDDAILETIRKQQGLSEGDVTSVNVGFNLVPALLSKKVDAIIGGYRNVEGIQIGQETGTPATIVSFDELGIPHFDELVIVANRDRLKSDPAYADAVRRFIVGMAKGAAGAEADVPGSVEIAKQDMAEEYKPDFLDASVPATIELLEPPGTTPYSCLDLDAWATFGKWMVDNGLLKAPIDVSQVATNDYNPACGS